MRPVLIATLLLTTLISIAGAQTIGEVSTTPLAGGQATLTLDFTSVDYELILYASNFTEADTSRSYDYEILGSTASKVIPLQSKQDIGALTPHDQLARLLRAEERARSAIPVKDRRARSARKQADSAIGSTRSFVFEELGDVTSDRSITATLVATNDAALAYLDDTPSDSALSVTTQSIQEIIDRFSSSSQSIVDLTFGGPSDVDGDGKLLFLFTPTVDETGPFGGFFRSGSVLTTSIGGDGNLADLIYLSPSRDIDKYESLLAHEYQHLVNFNQHFFVNGGDGEESWLNEALSHFTEDLVGEHVAGGNPSRLDAFLAAPESFRMNGAAFASSGIRAAAYLTLQTMIDLHGSTILSNLVNTDLTGIENIEASTGATFDSLFETFVTRNFLSATGLNSDATLNYGSAVLTDPATGGRIMPPVMDRQIALPSTAVAGQVRPTAAAYFRLTAEDGSQTIQLTADADADLVAITIPIDRTFQVNNVLPTDYLPQLTLDAPLVGNMTTGEVVTVEGTVANASNTTIQFRFDPVAGGQDTLNFVAPIENGRFKSILVTSHDQAGTYQLNIFSGDGESLPFVGKLPIVSIQQGEGPINLPTDFFPGIQFDTVIPAQATSGESLRLAGTISDPEVSIVLFSVTDPAGQETKFQATVDSGRFELLLLFNQDQIGSYEAVIFMGATGETLPIVGFFPSFDVIEGEGAFSLPSDFFEALTLDSGFPTEIQVGQGVSVSGTVTDLSIEILLIRLTEENGTQIQFQTNVIDGAFRKGLVFFSSQAGTYTLDLFGGPSGEILSHRGTFSPINIVSSGSESVILPVDIFSGILLDEPLPADFFLGQSRMISGVLADASANQIAVRFDNVDGTAGTSEFFTATNGRFTITAPPASAATGDYTVVIFAGQAGASLPQVDSFGPVSIVASQPRIALSTEPLSFGQTEVGAASTLTLTLENTGSETLSLSEAIIDAGPYTVSPNSIDIPAGASSTLSVTFAPTAEGNAPGTLRVVTNDPNRPAITIDLTGTAPPPPLPQAIPVLDTETLSWGNVSLGTPTDRTLLLENGGTATLVVDSVRVEGPFTVMPLEGVVEPGASISFDLVFDPQEAGSATGTLTIFTADPPTPLTVILAATGIEGSDGSADIDGNGSVGFSDFLVLASAFGKSEGQEGYVVAADINGDNTIGFGDFLILAAQFGS